jgi:hypothetical protein
MAKELKEKDEARKRSEGPGHVFHNASCEMVTGQGPYNIYVTPVHTPLNFQATCTGTANTHMFGNNKTYPTYQHFAQPPRHSVAANSLARQEQQHSSQPQPANLDVAQEHQIMNTILLSQGHIFTITGGSNQEHESKRARRSFERRVHTVSPRLPLNRLVWSMV